MSPYIIDLHSLYRYGTWRSSCRSSFNILTKLQTCWNSLHSHHSLVNPFSSPVCIFNILSLHLLPFLTTIEGCSYNLSTFSFISSNPPKVKHLMFLYVRINVYAKRERPRDERGRIESNVDSQEAGLNPIV